MTFEELNTFITLTQTRSFSRTAELLFTSQSTVSFRIKKIEAQIGRTLFERNTRSIELTPAGEDFLFYASQLDALYREAIHTASLNSFNYKVSIGAPDSFWQSMLLQALADYFQANKNISFKLVSEHSALLNQMIIEERLDVGVSFIPMRHPALEYLSLAASPYVLVAHKSLHLPTDKLTPQNFSKFPLIYCDWAAPFYSWFRENYCSGSHFIELDRTWLFLQMLQNKLGVGFMPLRIAKSFLETGEFISIEFESYEMPPLEENFIMYNRKRENRILPIVDAIMEYVKGNK